MPCERIQAQLADYSVGQLNRWNKYCVESHLARCPQCQQQWQSFQQVLFTLNALPEREAPPDLWFKVQRSFLERDAQRQSLPWYRARLNPRLVYAGAAMALATMGAALVRAYLAPPNPSVMANHQNPSSFTYVRQPGESSSNSLPMGVFTNTTDGKR